MLEELSKKNIAVFGLGVSGKSALAFCKKIGAKTIVVGDMASEVVDNISFFTQNDNQVAELLASQDLIILAPGIPREHPLLVLAIEKNTKVMETMHRDPSNPPAAR